MRPFISPLLKDETEQIIAKSRADLGYRCEQQKKLTRDIKRTRRLLKDSKRLLTAIDTVLHQVNSAWRA